MVSEDDLDAIQISFSSGGGSLEHSMIAAAKGSRCPDEEEEEEEAKESERRGGGRGRLIGFRRGIRVLGRDLGIPGLCSQLKGMEEEEGWNGVGVREYWEGEGEEEMEEREEVELDRVLRRRGGGGGADSLGAGDDGIVLIFVLWGLLIVGGVLYTRGSEDVGFMGGRMCREKRLEERGQAGSGL